MLHCGNAGTDSRFNAVGTMGVCGGVLSVTSGYFQLNNVTMGADGTVNLADSNVRAEWNGTAGGAFANDIILSLIHI